MSAPARILLLGASGQVGHALQFALRHTARELKPLFSHLACHHDRPRSAETSPHDQLVRATRDGKLDGADCERIDLSDLEELRAALDRIAPDLIVNAAAYTAVDRAEDEPDLAMRINAQAVGVLGEWAVAHDAHVVHYSTDYVFDGSAAQPYREDDPAKPVSAYGRSKLAGEFALRASGASHLILRTAWVYAPRGNNFLRTMLRLAKERDCLRVVDDQIGAPTPAELIAQVTAQVIPRWFNVDQGDMTEHSLDGVYHLTAGGTTTWHEFAGAILARAHRAGLIARVPEIAAIKTRDYPTRARRPAYSVLDTTLLRETFGAQLPDWREGLDEVFKDLAG
ncbi:MAG TPA: dTDP-4-dehydrorhamnose reductase [Rhodanobacteraceae bacterium]|nr:dTDP-4-dehydrorhamnose reductase [Rhodanobacteraceae bacterium]